VGMFVDAGHVEIDTAYGYSGGQSEEILGRILTSARRRQVQLATKANPWSDAGLKPERVVEQVETSLKRLNCDSVQLMYLHAPDAKTPIEATLEACDKLHRAGKFRELALSNYAAWQVVDIWHICDRNGWVLPTAYQGMYNAVTREVERELFPALRRLGIRFYAYNPLAGGLLTGKHARKGNEPADGRFKLYAGYADRYWKEPLFEALDILRPVCDAHRVPMTDAALRWIKHHGALSGAAGDGVTLGATRVDHLTANLAGYGGGPLPKEVVAAFERAWQAARPECPQYFRT
jgi:aflatoxin B1 aldehyde reductase